MEAKTSRLSGLGFARAKESATLTARPYRRKSSLPLALFSRSTRCSHTVYSATSHVSQPVNQLEALKRMSVVVSDTGEAEEVKRFETVDCTTNPSLVLETVQMEENAHMLHEAVEEEMLSDAPFDKERPYAGVATRLAVNIGAALLDNVPGRVSTEVDAHLSYDTQATLAAARRIVELYDQKGLERSRLYIKIAATWEGIAACEQLQAEGVDCNMTLVFSLAQAIACGRAKAAVMSPFVSRITDWYAAHEGGEYVAAEAPGVQFARRVHNYCKAYDVPTRVMAASFHSAAQVRELAGMDNLTIKPALLAQLEACRAELPRRLAPQVPRTACADEEVKDMDEALFRRMHRADAMASTVLALGIQEFAAAERDLENLLATLARQQGCEMTVFA